MSLVVWNFVLALVWAATTEAFTPANFAVGMAIGFVLLFGLRRVIDSGASDHYPVVATFENRNPR